MGFKKSLKNLFIKLGENNKPTYAVMAIAVVKGIARPLFTMTDKHADPETKKYTAIREGLTEVVAIPTYFACGELAGKVADKLNFSHIPKEKQAYARQCAKQNFMFLGVCTAALLAIPALASITIKPFMKKIQEDRTKNKTEKIEDLSIKKNSTEDLNIETKKETHRTFKSNSKFNHLNNIYVKNHGGLRVGGI